MLLLFPRSLSRFRQYTLVTGLTPRKLVSRTGPEDTVAEVADSSNRRHRVLKKALLPERTQAALRRPEICFIATEKQKEGPCQPLKTRK